MKRQRLFLPDTKIADMVLQNYTLLSVLPRFDILLGFGDKNISTICREIEVDEKFFLIVCNLHTFEDYKPTEKELVKIDMRSIITYLKKSHDYYTNYRVSAIEKKLETMSDSYEDNKYFELTRSLFNEYKGEIIKHFDYEESVVFPYVDRLLERLPSEEFNIDDYGNQHDNIDDKLSDFKNIILKYLPANCSTNIRNEILHDVFLFEDDLAKHTRIEERILTPLVRRWEERHE